MDEFEKLLKKHDGTIEIFKSLTVISIPVQLPGRIDIGFATNYYAAWLGRIFPMLRHFPILKGLYIYGDRAEVLSRIIGRDEALCTALRYIFDQYAFDVECSEMRLIARLGSFYRTRSLDPSGGWYLISHLETASKRLSELNYSDFEATPKSAWIWGPRTFRKIFNIAMAVAVFLITLSMIYFAVHGARSLQMHP
ncbi:hypothetical protein [Paraburkholderia bannensis]|uniref:hypothetical protein n=1 Tax=Paraburkholderia bannensis TaxID=765414 RepID=UPI0005AB666B|nr:hypothetical protein [Paraburkholderia bannensis]